MMIEVAQRVHPLRKPKGFEPAVQRWSVALPGRRDAYFVTFFGIQAPDAEAIERSGFLAWIDRSLARPDGPSVHDHARHVDDEGQLTHIVTAYWVDPDRHASFAAAPEVAAFWSDPAKRTGPCGYFRESLTVPVDRQETLYWQDYRAAFSGSDEVAFYPTPYCGYYGAMRDRIPLAATDALPPAMPSLPEPRLRETKGAHLTVVPPENFAVIRSATYWGDCDPDQLDDFRASLRNPLERGMQFLRENAAETGCCALRYQQTVGRHGEERDEAHALGYFLSLSHLEGWAEGHASHHAIFSAAIARYRKYGAANQLRTWHEVFVLPAAGQRFEYVNCSPGTGLLPWFEPHAAA